MISPTFICNNIKILSLIHIYALKVFIYAPFEDRVQTVMKRLDREEKSARKLVKRMDKERRAYFEFFTDQKWLDMGPVSYTHLPSKDNTIRVPFSSILSVTSELDAT